MQSVGSFVRHTLHGIFIHWTTATLCIRCFLQITHCYEWNWYFNSLLELNDRGADVCYTLLLFRALLCHAAAHFSVLPCGFLESHASFSNISKVRRAMSL